MSSTPQAKSKSKPKSTTSSQATAKPATSSKKSTTAPTTSTSSSSKRPPTTSKPTTSKRADYSTSSAPIVCYTYGEVLINGRHSIRGGVGVWFERGRFHHLNVAEPLPDVVRKDYKSESCHRAQLWALIRALQSAPVDATSLILYTDSAYAVRAINDLVPLWETRRWRNCKRRPVANGDLLREVLQECDERRARGGEVSIEVLPEDDAALDGNGEARELATEGGDRHCCYRCFEAARGTALSDSMTTAASNA